MEKDAAAADDGKCVLQGRYELGRVLGHGNFGCVHAARDLRTGRGVAVKVVAKAKLERAGMSEQMLREIAAMKTVSSHPNIVELHEVLATRSKIYLALELVRGGELFSRVAHSRAGAVRVRDHREEHVARRYFRQLVSAVGFCHARGVFHRDLKLENLLLDGDDLRLKVADFGLSALARHARSDGLLHTACGTPSYVAPEVLAGKGYDGARADLWSCGVILYVLLVGTLPFHDDNLMVMYRKMQRGEFRRCPPWVSPDARNLIAGLLDPDPTTRFTVARIVETPWYQNPSLPVVLPPLLPLLIKQPAPGQTPDDKEAEPEVLNAFHLISLSEGFDLSPLFDVDHDQGRGVRSATREAASSVVSRLESSVTGSSTRVAKSVRSEAVSRGRTGARMAVAAEVFGVAPSSVLGVDVKKDGGDTTEYDPSYCSDELRPALKDIVIWASAEDTPGAA